MLASLVIGGLTERLLIRRFEGSDPLVGIVATVAVLICFNGLVSLIWGGSVKAFPSMFPGGVLSFAGARVTWGDVGTVAVLLLRRRRAAAVPGRHAGRAGAARGGRQPAARARCSACRWARC